ncbi:MAG: hypothetical protein QME66_11660 [Candidatus Eisenbacteria bacterium]|nr:hypothetical protein [Candidatus Eisenbacteria bacterium]
MNLKSLISRILAGFSFLFLAAAPSSALDAPDSLARTVRPFAPSYSTSYDHDRTISTWKQSFGFSYSIRKILVSNNTSVSLGDDARTNRTTRNSSLGANVDYKITPKLSVGFRTNFSRYLDEWKSRKDLAPLKQGKEQIQISSAYSFNPFKAASVDITANGGSQSDQQDTREGNGKSGAITAALRYNPTARVSFSSEGKGDFSRLSSKEKLSGFRTSDRNMAQGFTGTLSLKPSGFLDLAVSGGITGTQFQYPQQRMAGAVGQETRKGESDNLQAKADFLVGKKFKGSVTGKFDRSSINYSLESDKSSDATTRSVTGEVSHELPRATSLTMNLSNQVDRSAYQGTSRSQNGSVETRTFGGSVGTKIGRKTGAKVIGSMTLVRYEYDDPKGDDRDAYNDRLRFELSYQASPRVTGGAGISKAADRSVYIRAINANNTRKGDSYTIDANVSYRPSGRVSLLQRYSLTADYTRYPRISEKNYLTRTNQIITGLTYSPVRRISFDTQHSFRYQDRGSYIPDETGVEKYGLAGGNNVQDLSLALKYNLSKGLNVSVTQRFQSNRDFTMRDGKRTMLPQRKALQLSRGADMSYSFRDGGSLRASLQMSDAEGVGLGSIDKKYWKANVVYSKTFAF